METHPLNLAHQQHRRAEALLKCHRYDEAVQCHHNAAELLLDAMKSTSSSVALESITLQHSYHLKQKDLIRNKKEQFARVKKAIDHLKTLSKLPTLDLQCNDNTKVEVAIYKTINETDSLLGMLSNTQFDENTNNEGKDAIDGKVVEKKQETVVEELQILNHNLHSLIEKLVLQIEVLKDENTTLKERVNYLEKERNKYLNSQVAEYIESSNFNNLSIDVESSIAGPTTKMYSNNTTKVQRPQQPHFDLSAFRDD